MPLSVLNTQDQRHLDEELLKVERWRAIIELYQNDAYERSDPALLERYLWWDGLTEVSASVPWSILRDA
jgi:hypothetical protein